MPASYPARPGVVAGGVPIVGTVGPWVRTFPARRGYCACAGRCRGRPAGDPGCRRSGRDRQRRSIRRSAPGWPPARWPSSHAGPPTGRWRSGWRPGRPWASPPGSCGRWRRTPARVSPRRTWTDLVPSAGGEGVAIVVNPGAGAGALGPAASPAEVLRAGLPEQPIVELDDPADLVAELERLAIGMPGAGRGGRRRLDQHGRRRGAGPQAAAGGGAGRHAEPPGPRPRRRDRGRRPRRRAGRPGGGDRRGVHRRGAVPQHGQLRQLRRPGRRREELEGRIGKWPAMAVALAPGAAAGDAGAGAARRRGAPAVAGVRRQLPLPARGGWRPPGGSGSTTASSTCGWSTPRSPSAAPGWWSPRSPARCAAAGCSRHGRRPRSMSARPTARSAWPATARRSTAPSGSRSARTAAAWRSSPTVGGRPPSSLGGPDFARNACHLFFGPPHCAPDPPPVPGGPDLREGGDRCTARTASRRLPAVITSAADACRAATPRAAPCPVSYGVPLVAAISATGPGAACRSRSGAATAASTCRRPHLVPPIATTAPCLWSRHVDDVPGDRAGRAERLGHGADRRQRAWRGRVGARPPLHRLRRRPPQPTAGDDSPLLLVRIAVGPLAQPPFPLDLLSRL